MKMSLVSKNLQKIVSSAYKIKDKKNRQEKLKKFLDSLESFSEEIEVDIKKLSNPYGQAYRKNIVREKILSSKIRIDGRKIDEVRQIECETGLLPRAHGSALFTRGETQAIAALTLGTSDDEQMIDSLKVFTKKNLCCITTFLLFL